MAEKVNQPGFFISADGNEFHVRPKTGDKMIHKKEKKKPKKHAITPYREIVRFRKSQTAREDRRGTHDVVTLDGDESLIKISRGVTQTSVLQGSADSSLDDRPVSDTYKPENRFMSFSELSEKAQGLYRKLEREGRLP